MFDSDPAFDATLHAAYTVSDTIGHLTHAVERIAGAVAESDLAPAPWSETPQTPADDEKLAVLRAIFADLDEVLRRHERAIAACRSD